MHISVGPKIKILGTHLDFLTFSARIHIIASNFELQKCYIP